MKGEGLTDRKGEGELTKRQGIQIYGEEKVAKNKRENNVALARHSQPFYKHQEYS